MAAWRAKCNQAGAQARSAPSFRLAPSPDPSRLGPTQAHGFDAPLPCQRYFDRGARGQQSRDALLARRAVADAVLINGEGSIHHSAARATFLLALLQKAQQRGKKVLLVNALFNNTTARPICLPILPC